MKLIVVGPQASPIAVKAPNIPLSIYRFYQHRTMRPVVILGSRWISSKTLSCYPTSLQGGARFDSEVGALKDSTFTLVFVGDTSIIFTGIYKPIDNWGGTTL